MKVEVLGKQKIFRGECFLTIAQRYLPDKVSGEAAIALAIREAWREGLVA